jgi:hypothetical protein
MSAAFVEIYILNSCLPDGVLALLQQSVISLVDTGWVSCLSCRYSFTYFVLEILAHLTLASSKVRAQSSQRVF